MHLKVSKSIIIIIAINANNWNRPGKPSNAFSTKSFQRGTLVGIVNDALTQSAQRKMSTPVIFIVELWWLPSASNGGVQSQFLEEYSECVGIT